MLSSLDAFSRVHSEFRAKTKIGAILSLVAISTMVILFLSETVWYFTASIRPRLYVDTTLGEQLQINLDVSFPSLPCAFISVNAMDKTGNHQLNIHHNILTVRIDKDGNPISNHKGEKEIIGEDKSLPDVTLDQEVECGSCYGAELPEKPCCATCEDVQEAYRRKGWAFSNPNLIVQCIKEHYTENLRAQKDEGCRVHGTLKVERVGGNVNIVPGKFIIQNSRYVVDSDLFQFNGDFNSSHKVNTLSFGREYPGIKNPLDGKTATWTKPGSPMYEYYVQVVPTIWEDHDGEFATNQYSVTEYMEVIKKSEDNTFQGRGVPGLFIMYELSPIIVDFEIGSKSFIRFFINLCAIIGGIFTVASLLDILIRAGLNTREKKIELGKFF
jgi:hypothetical protein